jgi:hypothetical protein
MSAAHIASKAQEDHAMYANFAAAFRGLRIPQPELLGTRVRTSFRPYRILRCASAVALVAACAGLAEAVERSCGDDPVANTATVLCTAPSGPCTLSEVTLGGNIEVTSGGCKFDLGGRSFRINKTLQMIGGGFIVVENAHEITITSTGKLKARGDFILSAGEIIPGGLIRLVSSGALVVAGRLETSGDGAGTVELIAAGAVELQPGSVVQENGISSSTEEGDRFADGGTLSVLSSSGDITVDGLVYLNGQNHGAGGALHLQATGSIEINQSVEVTGGAGGGGDVDLRAGDNIVITRPIDVDSRSGGGEGGSISIEAGDDDLEGILPGGSILVDNTRLELNGSPPEGDGGELDATARGALQILGVSAAIRANAGSTSSGRGGSITFTTGDANLHSIGPKDGDLVIQGQVLAQGGSDSGEGGRLEVAAGRDLVLDASSDLSSRTLGGVVEVSAGRHITIQGPISARATSTAGTGGSIGVTAGLAADATLMVTRDIDATGGVNNGRRQAISFASCSLIVASGVKIDGHAGTAANGALGGAVTVLAARNGMELRGTSQYLANPGGRITLVHPPSMMPVVDPAATFNPPRRDDTSSPVPFPNCGS